MQMLARKQNSQRELDVGEFLLSAELQFIMMKIRLHYYNVINQIPPGWLDSSIMKMFEKADVLWPH